MKFKCITSLSAVLQVQLCLMKVLERNLKLMSEEINQLKNMIDKSQKRYSLGYKKPWTEFGSELTSILSSPAKLTGRLCERVGSLF